ncbi:MAG: hypothetical protein ACRDSN_23415 [Pseudonocardiaceae bacterium]
MSRPLEIAFDAIERSNADQDGLTRRRLVTGAGATLGGMGLLGLGGGVEKAMAQNDPQTILHVAATAEVLATIVNTVGPEKIQRLDNKRKRLDRVTLRNVKAAAREELIHYDVLKSIGAQEITKRIWVPDAVFANKRGLLKALEVGDQIFINAYLIGTTAFADAGLAAEARYTGEFMGVEAVHRALARQSLGKPGNDRAFMRYAFTEITDAVSMLEAAGFGFGAQGAGPGKFYEFDAVRQRTPDPKFVNTRTVA